MQLKLSLLGVLTLNAALAAGCNHPAADADADNYTPHRTENPAPRVAAAPSAPAPNVSIGGDFDVTRPAERPSAPPAVTATPETRPVPALVSGPDLPKVKPDAPAGEPSVTPGEPSVKPPAAPGSNGNDANK